MNIIKWCVPEKDISMKDNHDVPVELVKTFSFHEKDSHTEDENETGSDSECFMDNDKKNLTMLF